MKIEDLYFIGMMDGVSCEIGNLYTEEIVFSIGFGKTGDSFTLNSLYIPAKHLFNETRFDKDKYLEAKEFIRKICPEEFV